MNIDEILSKPAFSKVPEEQRASFKSLICKLNNKTVSEAMPILLAYMSTSPKTTLSKEEQDAMTEAVIESLNESDRAKFKAMLAFTSTHSSKYK